METKRILEAALFVAGRSLSFDEIAAILKCEKENVLPQIEELQKEMDAGATCLQIEIEDEKAEMQVKPAYLQHISSLSKVELSRKAMKILALVAKKGELLQSDLHDYFKGDIYAYVTELKEKGYLASEKSGNTRKLKPTLKFREEFQIAIENKHEKKEDAAEQKDEAQQKLGNFSQASEQQQMPQ
jgi:chromosome segregation and condensation protein ScpB